MSKTLELIVRRASFAPKSVDEKERTVRVVWSTGAAVQRRDYDGDYIEVLSLDPKHVRLDMLKGAPVLDNHRAFDLKGVLGVVVNAGVDAGQGWADIKFSSRPEIEPIWLDVAAGIIRSLSVGYSVAKWQESKDPKSGARKREAIDWTPRELSFVALPADAGATVRSRPVETVDTQEAPPAQNRADTNTKIRSIATIAGLDTQFADGLINRSATIEQARAAAFAEMEKRSSGAPIETQRIEVGESHDEPAKLVERMSEALHCRMQPGKKPGEASRQYMNCSLLTMARILLETRGARGVTFWSPDDILKRAQHTTGDFPTLLTSSGNRVLMAAFESAPNPLKTLARQATIADFRAKTAAKLGPMGKLPQVNESGEVKSTSRTEAKESYKLKTFAEIFGLSRNAIINDDLSAFSDWSVAMGRAASETEADQLVQLLIANAGAGPTMDDTLALFHATHGNLAGAGGVIDATTLSDGRQAMRDQKDIDGKTPINTVPKYLLTSSVKETQAEQVLAALYPAQVSNVNPFANKRYELLVEARLAGNAWYLFADPALQPVLEYAYLTSAQGPQLATREGWDVLGMEFRVTLDFGCGAVDHRGAYRNPGA